MDGYPIIRRLLISVLLTFTGLVCSHSAYAVVNVACNTSVATAIAANPSETVFQLAGTTGTPCTYSGFSNQVTRSFVTLLGGCAGQAISSCEGATIFDGGAANISWAGGNPNYGFNPIEGVRIDGIRIQNYLPNTSENNNSMVFAWRGWEFHHVRLTGSGGWGLSMPGAALIDSRVDDNMHGGVTAELGQPGLPPFTLIRGTEIDHNNTRNDNVFNDAGGIKMVEHGSALVFVDNYVHDNTGVGLWADIASDGWKILGNTFINNMVGVDYEISTNAEIAYNVLNNNYSVPNGFGACFWLSSPSNVRIYNNNCLVPNNTNAQALLLQVQARPDVPGQVVSGIAFTNNTVTFAGSAGGDTGFQNGNGASFSNTYADYNKYFSVATTDARFFWNVSTITDQTFTTYKAASGQDSHSTITAGTANVAGCTAGSGCLGSGWPTFSQAIIIPQSVLPGLVTSNSYPSSSAPLINSCADLPRGHPFNNSGSLGFCP